MIADRDPSVGAPHVDDLRCSVQCRASGVSPVGTAVTYEELLLVELPLPWPRDVADHPLIAGLASVLDKLPRRVRLQAVVPPGRDVAVPLRIDRFSRPVGPFRQFDHHAALSASPDLVATARDLLHLDGVGSSNGDSEQVLICSHGSRDRCCGSFGTRLAVVAEAARPAWIRRTSHLGGHRFAPTATLLPSGQCWAWLDPDLLDGIIARTIDPADVVHNYRGCSAFAEPAVQAAEREAFRRMGWPWFDHARRGHIEAGAADETAWTVRLDTVDPAGTSHSYRAEVATARLAPQPVCGQPLDPGGKHDRDLAVVSFAPVAAG